MIRNFFYCVLLFLLLGSGLILLARQKKAENEKVLPLFSSRAKMLVDSVNFKTASVGRKYRAKFVIKNVGRNPLVIKYVKSGCYCAEPKWSSNPIPSNATSVIEVDILPPQRGVFTRVLYLFCNDDRSPFPLKITANVLDAKLPSD